MGRNTDKPSHVDISTKINEGTIIRIVQEGDGRKSMTYENRRDDLVHQIIVTRPSPIIHEENNTSPCNVLEYLIIIISTS